MDDAAAEIAELDTDEFERALERLACFDGTPHEFVDEWNRLGWYEPASYVPATDEHGAEVIRVRFVTHGWSENEVLAGHIRDTMFHTLWWASSHRGGLHVYEVPTSAWDDRAWAQACLPLVGPYARFPKPASLIESGR